MSINYTAIEMDNYYLKHYGIPRRSGRYPWGSGDNPYQRTGDFLGRVQEMKKSGKTEAEIAEELGMKSSKELRSAVSVATDTRRAITIASIRSMMGDGLTTKEISKKLGKPESTIKGLMNEEKYKRSQITGQVADKLEEFVDKHGVIEVGSGTEYYMGVSKTRLDNALYICDKENYPVYTTKVVNPTNRSTLTSVRVVCPKGTKYEDLIKDKSLMGNSKSAAELMRVRTATDGKEIITPPFQYPSSMDSKRIKIRYAEEGGKDKDGLVEIRRGVPDLDLGKSNYAQVRILVDGTHYVKGMATYSDDMPDGVDLVFNTNKHKGTPMCGPKDHTVLKNIDTKDATNPFGSLIKPNNPNYTPGSGQSYYKDPKTGEYKLSLINKRAEEGDWTDWDDTLPSQFLAKQNKNLIKKQLNLSIIDKQDELDTINSLENPTVRKKYLMDFAQQCDKNAITLKAAALPRQKWFVIVPEPSLKDNEVYAPKYENGEMVAAVRYPHEGTYQIPLLRVNNNNKAAAAKIPKTSVDAICVNANVAERLSGADFDGDTVMLIPTHDPQGNIKITSSDPLKGLADYDAKEKYPYREGMKVMSKQNTGKEMGIISNLIMDMTLQGADENELAAATRHSMCVIDAAKHKLDYKQSEIDNNILALKKKYQGKWNDETQRWNYGANTIITRAKAEASGRKTVGDPKINPDTGELIWKYKERKDGTPWFTKSTQMAETDDAHTLVLDENNPVESLYADYANNLMDLAKQARKDYVRVQENPIDTEAKRKYAKEVAEIKSNIRISQMNEPFERKAKVYSSAKLSKMEEENPDLTKKEITKFGQMYLEEGRALYGAKRKKIHITDKQWEAIQNNAVGKTDINLLMRFAEKDELRDLAMPSEKQDLSSVKINRIKAMSGSNYTIAEIAKACGVSTSTVSKYLSKGGK